MFVHTDLREGDQVGVLRVRFHRGDAAVLALTPIAVNGAGAEAPVNILLSGQDLVGKVRLLDVAIIEILPGVDGAQGRVGLVPEESAGDMELDLQPVTLLKAVIHLQGQSEITGAQSSLVPQIYQRIVAVDQELHQLGQRAADAGADVALDATGLAPAGDLAHPANEGVNRHNEGHNERADRDNQADGKHDPRYDDVRHQRRERLVESQRAEPYPAGDHLVRKEAGSHHHYHHQGNNGRRPCGPADVVCGSLDRIERIA